MMLRRGQATMHFSDLDTCVQAFDDAVCHGVEH